MLGDLFASILFVLLAALAGVGMHSILKSDKIIISENVCLDAGLVIYNNNKCTTKEWVDEQVLKMIKLK